MKIDKLERFFITETSRLIGLYELARSNDPRLEKGVIDPQSTAEYELLAIKQMWSVLINYAQLYHYKRFEKVDDDLEKFYLTQLMEKE